MKGVQAEFWRSKVMNGQHFTDNRWVTMLKKMLYVMP